VSVTLSPPVRVAALAAALVLTGLGAFVFLLGGHARSETAATVVPATEHAVAAQPKGQTPARKPATKKAPALSPDLPAPVAKAFRNRKVVVVSVYVPGAPVDANVRGEARAGARTAVAGFVPISAASESALQKIVAKAGVLPAPAVVIMRRPGTVTATLGVTDRQTVAAAVAQAKSGR
jgi:hypothetical protein